MKVLITGATGLIGTSVWARLADTPDRYTLKGFDLVGDPGRDIVEGNVADYNEVRAALEGQDAVVHLGANGGPGDHWDQMRESNLVGAYNIFESAREAGVKRVIFASTGQVTWNYEQEDDLGEVIGGTYDGESDSYERGQHTWPIRPSGLYAATKAWGEALGRYYSDVHSISALCIRFSSVNRTDSPLSPTSNINPNDVDMPGNRSFSLWTSNRDAAQLVQKCLDAPDDLMYDIFYSGSDNLWGVRDISHARDVLGYQPEDRAEDFRPKYEGG